VCLSSNALANKWNYLGEMFGSQNYNSSESKDLIFTFKKEYNKFKVKDIGQADFYKRLDSRKRASFQVAGLENWKGSKYKTFKFENYKVLDVSGSYIRGDGERIYFREWYTLDGESIYTGLLTSRNKKLMTRKFLISSLEEVF